MAINITRGLIPFVVGVVLCAAAACAPKPTEREADRVGPSSTAPNPACHDADSWTDRMVTRSKEMLTVQTEQARSTRARFNLEGLSPHSVFVIADEAACRSAGQALVALTQQPGYGVNVRLVRVGHVYWVMGFGGETLPSATLDTAFNVLARGRIY